MTSPSIIQQSAMHRSGPPRPALLVLSTLVGLAILPVDAFAAPGAPTMIAPCGGETSQPVILVAGNAAGTGLLYQFEVYSDVGLTITAAGQVDVAQGAGATTSWQVPILPENNRYYWRVRARDAVEYGPFAAPACAFFVNSVNDEPGKPRLNSPAFGAHVNVFRPSLKIDNATDPDWDVLTYKFEVYRDPALSNLVAQSAQVAEGAAGTTQWQESVDLLEDQIYYWRARAFDSHGLAGAWSSTGQFSINVINQPPTAPLLVSPPNGSTSDTLRPGLVILAASDGDLDPLVYDWDLATDAAFTQLVQTGTDEPPDSDQVTRFTLAASLVEDHRYCWRARSDDGQAVSAYGTACFLVSTRNDPPSVPVLNNPSDNMGATTTTPVLSWSPSTDPEGEEVRYDIQVTDEVGLAVGSVGGVAGTWTSLPQELLNHGTYHWRARATDHSGVASAFSPANTFTVNAPVDNPEVVTDGGGCQAGGSPGPGSLLPLGLGLAALIRRRRREPKEAAMSSPRADAHRRLTCAALIGLVVLAVGRDAEAQNTPPGPPPLSPQPATVLDLLRPDLVILEATDNNPPSVPVLNYPSDNMDANTTTPVFSWAPSTDPEGEPLTYEIEVQDLAGDLVALVRGINGTVTSIAAELTNCSAYTWRARATDRSGASSTFSPTNTFTVDAPCDSPWVAPPAREVRTCGQCGPEVVSVPDGACQSSGSPGVAPLVAVGLGLAALIRRRRNGRR